ncbi:hypothetical protein PENDEC_c052G03691 [Penicillium decumbens]|uniref:Carboxylesterase type B domain-containing protein n=1 Tax=Penicillium decumbens TaxID=69771 RepID=A0A1V6NNJ3_PENDC|nr:hypothetical protein PENDEC_c052G03691 [Penicillium decumbens]
MAGIRLKYANCTDAHDTLQCLRAAPFDTLNSAFSSLSFLPVIDGTLVPEYTSVALSKGLFVKVPLLIGTNTDEGKIFAGKGVNTTEELAGYIEQQPYIRTTNNETVQDLLEAYPQPGSNSTSGQSDDTLPLSATYGAQFLRTARYTGDLGATHFEDVSFVFNNVLGQGMPSNAFDVQPATREEIYKQLGDLMSRKWMSFAATHSPNHHQVKSFQTVWPAYNLKTPQNMVLDGNTTSFVENDNWRAKALELIIEGSLDFSR